VEGEGHRVDPDRLKRFIEAVREAEKLELPAEDSQD